MAKTGGRSIQKSLSKTGVSGSQVIYLNYSAI